MIKCAGDFVMLTLYFLISAAASLMSARSCLFETRRHTRFTPKNYKILNRINLEISQVRVFDVVNTYLAVDSILIGVRHNSPETVSI